MKSSFLIPHYLGGVMKQWPFHPPDEIVESADLSRLAAEYDPRVPGVVDHYPFVSCVAAANIRVQLVAPRGPAASDKAIWPRRQLNIEPATLSTL